MLQNLRNLRPAATHTALAGAFALSATMLPGSTAPAHADPQPTYQVMPGTVLAPIPPHFVLPVRDYRLTGRFGDTSGLWSTVHTGLDFAAPSGTPIRSVANGVVTSVGFDGRYGNKTVVTLRNGTEVWYCHQSATAVNVGVRVRVGERIGYVGSTGNVTGPHLHLEIRPSVDHPVDPFTWLRARGLRP